MAKSTKAPEISNIHKNFMGTISFDAKFNGMRKAQDFIVYPIDKDSEAKFINIQSDTRYGRVNVLTGEVHMSASRAGANSWELARQGNPIIDQIDKETLHTFIEKVSGTASAHAGNSIVSSDNSGAANLCTM